MYKFFNKKCEFAIEKDGQVYTEPIISKYSEYMLGFRNLEFATVQKYIRAIHRYWVYSLYFPGGNSEDFGKHIRVYHNALKKGFAITKTVANKEFGIRTQRELFKSKKMADPSFEFLALESYFDFMINDDTNPLSDAHINNQAWFYLGKTDMKALRVQEKHSKGSGYGLKARGMARDVLAPKLTIFTKYKRIKAEQESDPVSGTDTFPLEQYDKLLEVADDRAKLLYLLCGAASARRSQALQLTKYDVDLKNKDVYLTDATCNRAPLKDGKVFLGQPGRRELLWGKHKIDFEIGKYKKISSKYPIPTLDCKDRSIFFIMPKYESMFFEVYQRFLKKINPRYPMIFQTQGESDDPIWLPSHVNKQFNRNVEKLNEKYSLSINLTNGIHSLRHMFGVFMANMAYYLEATLPKRGEIELPNKDIKNVVELFKVFAAKRMGHSHVASVDRYFRPDEIVDLYVRDIIVKNIEMVNDFRGNIDFYPKESPIKTNYKPDKMLGTKGV